MHLYITSTYLKVIDLLVPTSRCILFVIDQLILTFICAKSDVILILASVKWLNFPDCHWSKKANSAFRSWTCCIDCIADKHPPPPFWCYTYGSAAGTEWIYYLHLLRRQLKIYLFLGNCCLVTQKHTGLGITLIRINSNKKVIAGYWQTVHLPGPISLALDIDMG